MSELRWILLGLGLVLIGVIYLLGRRSPAADNSDYEQGRRIAPQFDESSDDAEPASSSRSASLDAPPALRREQPVLSDADNPATVTATADPEVAAAPSSQEPPLESASAPPAAEKVIALHLVPNPDETFTGTTFVDALQAEGLKFGRFDIFHRHPETESGLDQDISLFSVANIIKPGTLSLSDLERQELKGASMFLVLPGPADPVAAFADMVATGRRLAATLNGQLLDGHGTKLSRQRASHLREDIINYQHGLSTADTIA